MSLVGVNDFLSLFPPLGKVSWKYFQCQSAFICSLGIWVLATGELQAIPENSVSSKTSEYWNFPIEFTNFQVSEIQSVIEDSTDDFSSQVALKGIAFSASLPDREIFEHNLVSVQLHYPSEPPFLIAAPENFNPGLRLPPQSPQVPPEVSPPPESTEPVTPAIVLERLTTEFRNDQDNLDQTNQFIEETAQFRLRNGNLVRFKTGLNSFDHPEVDSVTNIPIQVSWEGKIDAVTLELGGGVDVFDRLPTALNLKTRVELPIAVSVSPEGTLQSGIFPAFILEQGSYKFNAETLDNQITAWRFGPNLYWQIDPNTSFFTFLRLGLYNDGNEEWQSFSRLERKIGQFFVAGNFFTWSYQEDLEATSGYFSPSDFLVYNAEVGWEGDIFDFLRCRLAVTLGQQRLQGDFDNANSYQARCTAQLSPNVAAELGYIYSNVQNQSSEESEYNNQSISGKLQIRF